MKDEYCKFLKERGIKQKYIPYYVKWVKRCYGFLKKPSRKTIGNNDRERFLKEVSKMYEDWQINQADYALKLYDYFLSVNEPQRKNRTGHEKEWSAVVEDTVKVLRLKRRSFRTEQTYLKWLKRFKEFVRSKNPSMLEGSDLQNFLTRLAVIDKVSASTQNQALNAILFVYRHVLQKDIANEVNAIRAKEKRRLPVVLSRKEIEMIFAYLDGVYRLMARLTYGCGLRVSECVRLRIKDIDLEKNVVIVRSGKGDHDRITILPESLEEDLLLQIDAARYLFEEDRLKGVPGVSLPGALARKYPTAGQQWGWFWLFPARSLSVDPRTNVVRRHHIHSATFQRVFKKAVKEAGIAKQASVHSLRHSFATHLLENGYDIRTVQELLGHKSVQTTMIYTHIAKKNIMGVKSPLDLY